MGRHYLRVAEALALIVIARLLVALAPFSLWSPSLGRPSPVGPPARSPPDLLALACAHTVERASARLPGTLCLPRAMCLQWMLRRRRIASTLVLGVLPEQLRGGLNDLHAWVELARFAILGGGEGSHRTILRLE